MALNLPPSSEASANIVSTVIEHPSVIEPLQRLAARGYRYSQVGPDQSADFPVSNFFEVVNKHTKLVSVMMANNETGQVLPVGIICGFLKEMNRNIIFHSDGVQALGKLDFRFHDLGIDLLSLSAHKIGGMQGVGALVIRKGCEVAPFILGGPQEKRLRAGTENVLGIASFGIAAKLIKKELHWRISTMTRARDTIANFLRGVIPDLKFNLPGKERLPNTLNLRIPGILADDLVVALDLEGLLISSGAACASGKPEPSHVLMGMGLSDREARESVRISVGYGLNDAELEQICATMERCITRMRSVPR